MRRGAGSSGSSTYVRPLWRTTNTRSERVKLKVRCGSLGIVACHSCTVCRYLLRVLVCRDAIVEAEIRGGRAAPAATCLVHESSIVRTPSRGPTHGPSATGEIFLGAAASFSESARPVRAHPDRLLDSTSGTAQGA